MGLWPWPEVCDNFELQLCAAPAVEEQGEVPRSRWDLPAVVFVFLGVGFSAFLAAGCYAFRKHLRPHPWGQWGSDARPCFSPDEEARSMMADQRAIGACSPAPSL